MNAQQPKNSKDIEIMLRRCGYSSPEEVRRAFNTPQKRKRATPQPDRAKAAELCACDI